MKHDSRIRKCAFLMADRHLSELPKDTIIAACPRHYGLELTDEHKLFMWNGLVDHYLELPAGDLWQLFDKHITHNESIVKPLHSEIEEMVAYHVEGMLRLEDERNLALVSSSLEERKD